jgi:hypothetical protein
MMDFHFAGRVSLPAYFFVIEDPDEHSRLIGKVSS